MVYLYLRWTEIRQGLLSRNIYDRVVTPLMQTVLEQVSKKEDQVSKIVEKVLTQVFGEEATRLIYKHLEHHYSLKRNEVAERIDIFAKGLEDFLRSGAYVIEKKILEDIYSSSGELRRIEIDKINSGLGFVGEMKLLMRKA